MSRKNDFESKNEKKVDENSYNTDSGFHSGFQDSCEILSSEVETTSDNIATGMEGNSHMEDKGNFTDSGIISSGYISQSESISLIEKLPYVPDYFNRPIEHRNRNNPVIDKYFEQDEEGYTKLHISILHSIEPAIKALISLVSDSSFLNIRNCYGQTALHLSVLLDQPTTVKQLINAGADVNIRDYRCNTALHLACLNENMNCVQTIISAVHPQKEKKILANLEQWNYDGESCFFIACKSKNLPIMRALVASGANVNAREGKSGYTPLHLATEMKANDVIRFLCEECNTLSLDTENFGGLTAFQLSLMTNQEALANYLITKGATPYFTSENSDMEEDDSSNDYSGDELENNQIINKIAEISVN